jgi:hypothetical protein
MLIVEMSNLAFLSYSPGRDTDIHGVDRHLFKHHCTRTYDGVFADRHPRQYVCAGTQKNTAANPGSAADRHPRTDMGEIPDLDLMIDNGAMIDNAGSPDPAFGREHCPCANERAGAYIGAVSDDGSRVGNRDGLPGSFSDFCEQPPAHIIVPDADMKSAA